MSLNSNLIDLQCVIHESDISKKICNYNSLLFAYKFMFESYKEKHHDLKLSERLVLESELEKYYDKCKALKEEIEEIIEHDIKYEISQCEGKIYFDKTIQDDIVEIINQIQNWENNKNIKIEIKFDHFNTWKLDYHICPVDYLKI